MLSSRTTSTLIRSSLRPRFQSTATAFIPSFSNIGSTSASTLIPHGDPSLASSAYLPSQSSALTPSASSDLSDPATTQTPLDLTSKQRTLLERIIRVDQAGELGANYIYRGQLAVLKLGNDRECQDLVQVRSFLSFLRLLFVLLPSLPLSYDLMTIANGEGTFPMN
jgi:hypothetical protein